MAPAAPGTGITADSAAAARARVGVLLSGRGSNIVALAQALVCGGAPRVSLTNLSNARQSLIEAKGRVL